MAGVRPDLDRQRAVGVQEREAVHTGSDDRRPGVDLLREDLVDPGASDAPGRQVDRDLVAGLGAGQPEGQRFVGREEVVG